MHAYSVRPAGEQDADLLGRIGPAAYHTAYAYLWDQPEALAAQLATFNAAAFATLLARPDARVWVAENKGEAAGFLSLISHSPSPVSQRAGGAEIPRIYLLPDAQGCGLGRLLLGTAIEYAAAQGMDYLWLDVMASAERAIAAYQRWGFVEVGRKQFATPVRVGLGEMVVMELGLVA